MNWGPGYGMGMGVGWFGVVLGLLALAALTILVVRSFTTGPPPGPPPGSPPMQHGQTPPGGSNARAIVEERLARGEITPDEYREIRRALDESSPPPGP
jgi:putative membrane protein